MLIQNNFGCRIKIFGEVTDLIKKEMDKYLFGIINEYYSDILSVNNWKYFVYESKEIKNNAAIFLNSRKMNLFKNIIDKYKEYSDIFNTENKKELDEKLNDSTLTWDQTSNIEIKFQKMFDILYSNQDISILKFDDINILNNNTNKS